jgi:hypothetical protein
MPKGKREGEWVSANLGGGKSLPAVGVIRMLLSSAANISASEKQNAFHGALSVPNRELRAPNERAARVLNALRER